jgi:hypothetical protein
MLLIGNDDVQHVAVVARMFLKESPSSRPAAFAAAWAERGRGSS